MKIKAQKEDFRDYVLEQLSGLPDVFANRMFGGYGLYQGEYFFGILHESRLYLKTDDQSKKVFEARNMAPFHPSEKQVLKNYYEVPVDILEDSESLAEWVEQAILVTKNQPQKKSKVSQIKDK